MPLKILNPGIGTAVQDLGRPGYYHLGIPLSGAMDQFALRAANLLVGNDETAAGLESVFIGPQIEFKCDTVIAITGADIQAKLDGEPVDNWCSLPVKSGQVLSFDCLQKGARLYIAVAGGIDVPVVLGSRSTYSLGALGGFEGRTLAAGDELPIGTVQLTISSRKLDKSLRPEYTSLQELRVLPGLYWHRITENAKAQFFKDEWKVAPEADRIGYRFKGGTRLEFNPRKPPFGAGADPSNIVDSCYPYGSIQVPSGTEPIVLHRDAVSGGGYFMVGTVISADMDKIGQMQPNTPTRFVKVSMDQALKAREEQTMLVSKLRNELA